MTYPEDFIKEAKELYPENYELHEGLAKGNTGVDYYIKYRSYEFSIDPDEVIALFNEGRQQEILEIAIKAQRKVKFYEEYQRLYLEAALSHTLGKK